MTATTPAASNHAVPGCILALIGAALITVATWLPWISAGSDDASGWKLFDLRQDYDQNPFVVGEMFRDSFDPFVTGALVALIGVIAAVLAVVALVASSQPQAQGQVNPGIRFAGLGAFGVAALIGMVDVFTILRAPDIIDVGVGIGLLAVLAGAVLGGVGMALTGAAAGAGPRPAAATLTTPTGAPAADWYADGTGRHQLRYWDGTEWTANVSDDGVQRQDPI